MTAFIGHTALKGDFRRYSRQFNFLELAADPGRLPKRARLKQWAEQAPETFRFSLVLPISVASLANAPEDAKVLHRALGDAAALGATWVVLRTPSSVRPSSRTERLLEAFIRSCSGEHHIAWEPTGLWEGPDTVALAVQLGVTLVRDPLQSELPPGPVCYGRVRALGVTSKLTAGSAEHIAEALSTFETSYLAVEGGGAGVVKRAVGELLADQQWDAAEDESSDAAWSDVDSSEDGELDDLDDDDRNDLEDDEAEDAEEAEPREPDGG